MCGIAGIAGVAEPAAVDCVARMCRTMTHRGPDDSGLFRDPNVVLGHRRLSILDFSENGRQPMVADNGRVALVFNGEIYNFRELRQELIQQGHQFHGTSDSEVLLRAYLQHGEAVIPKLRGMFAFAIYDQADAKLILARDPLGMKPLYVWSQGGRIVFASELRAITQAEFVKKELNHVALAQTLALQSPLSGRTLWRDVTSLDPGEVAVWQDRHLQRRKYWDFPGEVEEQALPSLTDVREVLYDVVAQHLISDAPLGLLLSGGIDSSALAAIATDVSDRPLQTFNLAFPESPHDESHFAEKVATQLRTHHHSIPVTVRDMHDDVDAFLRSSDFPSADGLNVYTVCKHVRQAGVKVLLSGQGGDEAFAGYSNFRQLPHLERYLRLWRRLPRTIRSAGRMVGWKTRGYGGRAKLASLLEHSDSFASTYLMMRSTVSPSLLRRVWQPTLWHEYQQSLQETCLRYEKPWRVQDEVAEVARLESQIYMHDTLLRASDVYSMAHSLELRVPFVDQRVVELANRIPACDRVSSTLPKPMLLNLVRDRIPESCWRRRKGGFHVPVGRWLTGPLRKQAERRFRSSLLSDDRFFSEAGWNHLWQLLDQNPDSTAVGNMLWTAFLIGEWSDRQQDSALPVAA